MKDACGPMSTKNPFMTERKPKGPKVLEAIHAKRTADGKIAFQHHFSGYDHEPEMHVKTEEAAPAHFAKAMGIKHEAAPSVKSEMEAD